MSWIVEKKTSYVDVTMFARDFYIGSDLTNFQHPAIKILALAFLIMIGTALVAESLDFHIPKAYIYFSMAFALGVEFINIRIGTRQKEKGN